MTNTLTRDLKVISWNAQSLFPKAYEVIDFFETNTYDVICISETWLKVFHKLCFPSYRLYRVDRQTGDGGGVAIAVNKKVRHLQVPSLDTESIESVAVCVDTPTGPITFVSAYFPGTDLSPANLASFKNDIKILTSIKGSYFVCGDLNAKHRLWNNLRGNAAGNIIYEQLNYRPFMVYNSPTPTYFPPQAGRNPSNIDIVLSNHLHGSTQVIPNHDLMSDHCAIEFSVNCTIEKLPCGTKRFDFERADWDDFKCNVDRRLYLNAMLLSTPDEVEIEVTSFTNALLNAMNDSIPKRTVKIGHLKLSPPILSMIRTRNALKRQYQRRRNTNDLLKLKELSRKIDSSILNLRNAKFNSKIGELGYASNKFWKFTKLIKNKSSNMPPLRDSTNRLVYTNTEKAAEIGKSILKAHLSTENLGRKATTKLVERSVKCINDTQTTSAETSPFLTSPIEVKRLIRILKAKKSPGDDAIPNKVLKKLSHRAIVAITKICNACILLGYFPKAWKLAKVVAILKPAKNPTDPTS